MRCDAMRARNEGRRFFVFWRGDFSGGRGTVRVTNAARPHCSAADFLFRRRCFVFVIILLVALVVCCCFCASVCVVCDEPLTA